MRRVVPLLILLAASGAAAETFIWVDEHGVTHITDDPGSLPEAARPDGPTGRAELGDLWDDPRGGPLPPSGGGGGVEAERTRRLLRGAIEDLERGETARATVALRSVLRREPAQPEAHWYMALLDRQRGRYEAAAVHLRAFLASAGDDLGHWRASAERRLAELEDERRLADPDATRGPLRWVGLSTENFRVRYDAELGEASADYAHTVARYLEEARRELGARIGAVPVEPMGVVLYGKAAYLEAHRHRFSFQTVGFFDGRIHVVSAAHPAGELRALLFHEYTHAVFREHTGGDRPFWLNEGMAELVERSSRSQSGLTRSERSALRRRIDAGLWIPLRRLAPGFGGLRDEDARAAYLESTAAGVWLEARTDRAGRARILARIAAGATMDDALLEAVGLDTDGVDAALRAELLSEFAPRPASSPITHAPLR